MEKVENKPIWEVVPTEPHNKSKKDFYIPLSPILHRVFINLFYVILVLSVPILAGDYTITSYTSGGRSIPQQSDEIIAFSPSENMLQEVPSMSTLSPSDVVMRRRFSGEEYRLYKGTFTKGAFSSEKNLFSFALPAGMTIAKLVGLKFYSTRANNPNNDLPTIYFDNTHAYILIIPKLYYYTDSWHELAASNIKVDAGKAQPIGDIAVLSTPAGARITVDGEDKGVFSPNYVTGLFAGQHRVSVSLPDYQIAEKTVEAKDGETVNLSFDLLSALGSVEINSSPSGAKVTFNNVESGVTPLTLKNLKPGSYTISLALDLYKSQSKQFGISMNKKEQLNITFEPDFGTLQLPQPPSETQFAVDNKPVSSQSIKLNPGKHRISWSGGEEYSAIDTIVTIVVGGYTSIASTPVRLTGGIKILPLPMDAEVFVGGESKGTGAKNIKGLPTGTYTISGKRDGYQLTKVEVQVKANVMQTVNLRLTQIPDQDGDGVEDTKDKCPDEVGTSEFGGCKEQPVHQVTLSGFYEEEKSKRSDAEKQLLSTGLLLLDSVYFESGKSEISINSEPYLLIISKMLLKYPKLQVEVAGHTDNIGSYTKNMNLSQTRAESVKFFLIQSSPSQSNRLTAHGYGPSRPKSNNSCAEGRKVNRRVELQVLNKEVLSEYNR